MARRPAAEPEPEPAALAPDEFYDPEAERFERCRNALMDAGAGGKIRVTLSRKVDGGEDVGLPMLQLTEEELCDYQDAVFRRHGGGRFLAVFRAPSGQILGRAEFSFEGPPRRPVSEVAAPVAPVVPAGPTAREAELEARLAAHEAREKAAREAEVVAAAMAAAMAKTLAPFASRLEAIEARLTSARAAEKPVEAPRNPFEEAAIKKMQREERAELEGKVSPEIATLRDALKEQAERMDALLARDAARSEEIKADKAQRELEKRDAAIAALVAQVAKLAEAPVEKDPIEEALDKAQLWDIRMNARRGDDAPKSNMLEKLINRLGDKMGEPLINMLEKKATGVIDAVTTGAPAPSGDGKNGKAPPEDKAAFTKWLVYNFERRFTCVRDKGVIAGVLQRHERLLLKLAMLESREALVAFVVELGYEAKLAENVCSAEDWRLLVPRLEELKATLREIVADSEAAEKKRRAAEKKAEADKAAAAEAADEGDADADEGDEAEGDDQGDGESDEEAEGEEEGDGAEGAEEAPGARGDPGEADPGPDRSKPAP